MSERLTDAEVVEIREALTHEGQFVYRSTARALLAERDALAAELERVKALAGHLDDPHTDDDWEVVKASALADLRAALAAGEGTG